MRCLLVGNPNAGKTTLFNTLTGEEARVGNWSGVTVSEYEADFEVGNSHFTLGSVDNCPTSPIFPTSCGLTAGPMDAAVKPRHVGGGGKCQHTLVDLPGMYALDATERVDERITHDTITAGAYDVLVNVIDATQLERQLYLTSQLLELKRPMVIVLSMLDKAKRQGIEIDTQKLSQKLGVPVVQSTTLVSTLHQNLKTPKPLLIKMSSGEADQALAMMDARYTAVHALVAAVEVRASAKKEALTAKLDKIFLNRILAFPVFLAVMYTLFFLVISVGGFCQDWVMQAGESVLIQGGGAWLHRMGYPDGFVALLTHGLGLGVLTLLSFIPVMGVMFFLLAILEASGYMARVAFVMDRLMRFLGLPGKAFVPLMVGFGCNVPAIMATRTLESRRDRLLTILMSPFMSCSARLTIYTVFVAAFFPEHGYNVVFSLYLLGIVMAVLTGLLLRKRLFTGPISPLLLELPVYHMPVWRVLLKSVQFKLRKFLWRAGRFIVPMCLMLSVLNVVHVREGTSLLVMLGQGLQPLFAPMGISSQNWPAVVGLMTGVLAKEVVIGSLNSMYASVGSLAQMFDGAAGAYAYLLFILLYVPCASTMAVMREEAGRRVMWFSVIWSTMLAYGAAVLFYQLATLAEHPESSLLWGLKFLGLFGFVVMFMRRGGYKGGARAISPS